MADRELGPDVSGPKELPLDEGGLGYVTFTVSRELGPDVSSDEGILSGCPLCGSRMLQDATRDPETSWCPEDGYVDLDGPVQECWRRP